MVDRFTDDIKKTIDFYYAHFPNAHRITHLTLCGGVTKMNGLGEILSAKLGIETVAGHPLKNVSPALLKKPDMDSLEFDRDRPRSASG